MFLTHRKNIMFNICRIYKKAKMIKILSSTIFQKVSKVSPNATSQKIEWFYKGVWGISSPDSYSLQSTVVQITLKSPKTWMLHIIYTDVIAWTDPLSALTLVASLRPCYRAFIEPVKQRAGQPPLTSAPSERCEGKVSFKLSDIIWISCK